MDAAFRTTLTSLLSQPVEWGCEMAKYTSFSIGGPAAALVKVTDNKELRSLLQFLYLENMSWRVIGRGTNLLIKDEGYRGVIILLAGSFKSISCSGTDEEGAVRVSAGAGCSFTKLQKYCIEAGFAGLEFGFGIPGTLGGAVIMNAGAYGDEISSTIRQVEVITRQGGLAVNRDELTFSYRNWDDFQNFRGRGIVTGVELQLSRSNSEAVGKRCLSLHTERLKSQPQNHPNAGSFFKNPPGDSAGRLIDLCGLKGLSVGDAMVSTQHGNFLVNNGKATAKEIKHLMRLVQDHVKSTHGIDLEPEVHFI